MTAKCCLLALRSIIACRKRASHVAAIACNRCTLSRTVEPKRRLMKANGRPICLLTAWCLRAEQYDSKAVHANVEELRSYGREERSRARASLRDVPGSNTLFENERSDSEGDTEPEGIS